jgi:CRISPR-associated endonuclease/helicase Cas3
MRGDPTSFWGKLSTAGEGGLEWHPLPHHCADVAAVAEVLLDLPVWHRRLSRLAGRNLTPTDSARLTVLAFLHDLGKFNHGFQRKALHGAGPTAGHVREAVAALSHLPSLRPLNSWGEAAFDLLVVALCHHGRPYDCRHLGLVWQSAWWHPEDRRDPIAGVAALVAEAEHRFPNAFVSCSPDLPSAPAFGHAFAGLVTLADWIGSDLRFFPFSTSIDEDRIGDSRKRARRAIEAIGLAVPRQHRGDVHGRSPFRRVAAPDFAVRPAQTAVESLPLDRGGSLTILEAETGSGKTEAALLRFVGLFEAGEVDGLYFALPTRSAATEIHARVVAATRGAFSVPPPVVLAVPGYLHVDDASGQRLAPFDVLWPDKERFRYRGWASEMPKRFIVGCIVVGTIDQVLLSSLRVSHAHLRATPLLRHLLVVDEVHASDAYMTRILDEVLSHHRAAGGHALLLSATLAGEARARLLKSQRLPAFDEAVGAEYPLITHLAESAEEIPVRTDAIEKVVTIEVRPWLEDHGEVARLALSFASRGGRVLVIKNTVDDCIQTQMALERHGRQSGETDLLFGIDGTPAPHHSRFSRADRELLDRALERALGRKRGSGGRVVVATQTAQQSLDLDADVLVSDLCPADVMLQRVGRMHRHADRERPTGFERARLFVVVPKDRDLTPLLRADGKARHHHGLGSVYADLRILEATWRLIENGREWRIPKMCRHIVEASLHSRVLHDVVAHADDRWRAHTIAMDGGELGRRRLADLNVVDWSQAYSETAFPDGTDERILTRLGEGDRRVCFHPAVVSPFGISVDELTLRASWTRGVDVELDAAEEVVAAGGVVAFRFGGREFVYDRFGLRPTGQFALPEADDEA